MKTDNLQSPPNDGSARRSRWPWILAAGCLLVLILGLWQGSRHGDTSARTSSKTSPQEIPSDSSPALGQKHLPPRLSNSRPEQTAEEIVAGKVLQFGKSRREIVQAIARRLNKEVPPEVEKFFDAVEAGNWDEVDAQWKAMTKRMQDDSSGFWKDMSAFWQPVHDTYGAAEQAHLWPAQKLLDYGNAILDSLRPGMVYVGGTDNGRWIPELLNETSGGEQHIIVTQNAFADGTYGDYMNTLYGDRMKTLTGEDSQRAFSEYLADAQKRLLHDQQFPNEPRQVRPGEDITIVDTHVQVSGQVAVMAINEKLLQMMMEKNPDLSFAIQESFPLKGTYADAVPLGPLMELRADGQNTFTAERAAQSLEYWRAAAQQLLSDPAASGSTDTRIAYSHDTVSAANLLAAHNFNAEAEQAYRLANQLAPDNFRAVSGLSEVLARTERTQEARQLLDDFARKYPKQRKAVEAFQGVIFSASTQPPRP